MVVFGSDFLIKFAPYCLFQHFCVGIAGVMHGVSISSLKLVHRELVIAVSLTMNILCRGRTCKPRDVIIRFIDAT